MNDLKRTSDRMRRLEVTAQKKGWLNDIHPASKLFVTLACIILVISINQYNLPGLLGMCIYPVCDWRNINKRIFIQIEDDTSDCMSCWYI